MRSFNLFSFFKSNIVIIICLVLLAPIVIIGGIIVTVNHTIFSNILFYGTIYGDLKWPPYEELVQKAKTTDKYKLFEAKHGLLINSFEGLYEVDRRIQFETINKTNKTYLTFKVSPNGSFVNLSLSDDLKQKIKD